MSVRRHSRHTACVGKVARMGRLGVAPAYPLALGWKSLVAAIVALSGIIRCRVSRNVLAARRGVLDCEPRGSEEPLLRVQRARATEGGGVGVSA